jgi:CheY-like chemotaxis protein
MSRNPQARTKERHVFRRYIDKLIGSRQQPGEFFLTNNKVLDMDAKEYKATILCVDDSKDILLLCKSVLQRNGYRVHIATSGKKGLARLSQCEIDAAIIDYDMPEMDGVQLAHEIKRACSTAAVLMFSGSEPPTNLEAIDSFLPKSRGARALLDALPALLTREEDSTTHPRFHSRSVSKPAQLPGGRNTVTPGNKRFSSSSR